MAHLQQQVLDLIKATIVAGATAAGPRVFVDRVDPLQPNELPAILVDEAPDGEQIQPLTISGAHQRQLAVQINCIVAHGNAAMLQARELGLAVEKLLQTSAPLAALCRMGIDITSSRPQIAGDGDRLMATREQIWQFAYAARGETPDTHL